MKTITETDHPYSAAGRVWILPSYNLTRLPDGTLVVSQAELDRVHRAISNEICGSGDRLTVEELDFLCAVTLSTYVDVAAALGLNKSTVSRWRRPGKVPGGATSAALKRWFWTLLFSDSMGGLAVPVELLQEDARVLEFLHRRAIEEGAAERVLRRVA